MTLSLTAVYALISAWFFGPLPTETAQITVDTQTKQIFHAILYDYRPEFDALVQNIVDKEIVLPDGTTPLAFAIEQKQFHCCTELIKERFLASAQDLTQAQLMHTLESDPDNKKNAEICINFLEQYLQELKLIPKISDVKRGKEDQTKIDKTFEQIIQDPDFLLINATMNNDVATMHTLIHDQHADPNTCINYSTPLSIAIAQGHEEALACLIKHKVTITLFDEQKAFGYLEVVNTQSDEISYFPETMHQKEQKRLQIERTKRIHETLLAQRAKLTAQAQAPVQAPVQQAQAQSDRPRAQSLQAGPELITPILFRTSQAERIRQMRQNLTPEPRPRLNPTKMAPGNPKKSTELPPLPKPKGKS